MKYLLTLSALLLILLPQTASAMTDSEAKKQLALESQNLVAFGNPFGKTGKFEELYDPTGKPWWMIQLDKEAWSMETYGNPFGYPIAQRVLAEPVQVVAPLPTPVTYVAPEPVVVAPTPAPVRNTFDAVFKTPNCTRTLAGCVDESYTWDAELMFLLGDQTEITEATPITVTGLDYTTTYEPTASTTLIIRDSEHKIWFDGTYAKTGHVPLTVSRWPGFTTLEFIIRDGGVNKAEFFRVTAVQANKGIALQ